MKVVKAVYNFLVGDLVILIGIVLVFLLLALIHFIDSIRAYSGAILIVVVLVVLGGTLSRELRGREKSSI